MTNEDERAAIRAARIAAATAKTEQTVDEVRPEGVAEQPAQDTDLRAAIEQELRPVLEEQIRAEITPQIAQEMRPQVEAEIRQQMLSDELANPVVIPRRSVLTERIEGKVFVQRLEINEAGAVAASTDGSIVDPRVWWQVIDRFAQPRMVAEFDNEADADKACAAIRERRATEMRGA